MNQSGTVDAAVGHTARASQHAVARSTGEITMAPYRAIVLPFRASELQTQPKARGEICRTHVTDERHLIGAAEQDLHPHMETNLSIRPGRGPCRITKEPDTTAAGAPAPALRVGMTSSWKQRKV